MTSRAKTRLASLSEMAGSQVALPFARKINPDLQKERATATFNVGELTHIIDGGKEKTKRRKQIGGYLGWLLYCDPGIVNVTVTGLLYSSKLECDPIRSVA